jgi:CO/xanthine dehydrogenase Mo-binding subunit
MLVVILLIAVVMLTSKLVSARALCDAMSTETAELRHRTRTAEAEAARVASLHSDAERSLSATKTQLDELQSRLVCISLCGRARGVR